MPCALGPLTICAKPSPAPPGEDTQLVVALSLRTQLVVALGLRPQPVVAIRLRPQPVVLSL